MFGKVMFDTRSCQLDFVVF